MPANITGRDTGGVSTPSDHIHQACANALFSIGAELERQEYRTEHLGQPETTSAGHHFTLTSHQQAYRVTARWDTGQGSGVVVLTRTDQDNADHHAWETELALTGSADQDKAATQAAVEELITQHVTSPQKS